MHGRSRAWPPGRGVRRLGLHLLRDPIDPSETLDHNLQIYEYLTLEEQFEFAVGMCTALDSHTGATGADVILVLSDEEAACLRDGLTEEQLIAIAVATPLEAAR